MDSILQTEKECFLCHKTINLECHHVFGGANRKHSEAYGLKIWLCHECHNEPPYGVHHNRAHDLMCKQIAQEAFEKKYSKELFIQRFGRSWE